MLTDLPNRVLFVDRLGLAMAAASRSGTKLGWRFSISIISRRSMTSGPSRRATTFSLWQRKGSGANSVDRTPSPAWEGTSSHSSSPLWGAWRMPRKPHPVYSGLLRLLQDRWQLLFHLGKYRPLPFPGRRGGPGDPHETYGYGHVRSEAAGEEHYTVLGPSSGDRTYRRIKRKG